MNGSRESWFDEDAGPIGRLYAVTRGRTGRGRPELDMLTLVAANRFGGLRRTEPEYAEILRLSREPQSIAELAARLRLPLASTKVLVGDLVDDGLLEFRKPVLDQDTDAADIGVLRALLRGIQAL